MNEQKIEEIINSANAIKSVEPTPFLVTRVRAKLEESKSTFWDKLAALFFRPSYAVATVLLIIAVNILVLTKSTGTEIVNDNTNDEDMVAANYNTPTYYNLENNNDDEK